MKKLHYTHIHHSRAKKNIGRGTLTFKTPQIFPIYYLNFKVYEMRIIIPKEHNILTKYITFVNYKCLETLVSTQIPSHEIYVM